MEAAAKGVEIRGVLRAVLGGTAGTSRQKRTARQKERHKQKHVAEAVREGYVISCSPGGNSESPLSRSEPVLCSSRPMAHFAFVRRATKPCP